MANQIKRMLSLILTISMIFSAVACSSERPNMELSDPNSHILVENIETENIEIENIETETILTEFITSEIYLEELVIAEDKISELLLEEEIIDEVLICKTIYVPQDNIDEFSENSQTAGLFGDNVDISSVLKKVAVGTGVIVTLTVLKKTGLSDPIASIVVAAADKSLEFAAGGAAIGSLFGGLTGAVDEIDSSGRMSAVIGFATATAGLILTTVSLVAAIPAAGTTAVSAAAGIKLVIAGMSVLGTAANTVYSGYNAVKTFTSTEADDIDWNNIDWDQVGVSAAQRAIQNGADGYMWGSIIGTVYGGVEGYEFYHKFHTPYTSYYNRWKQTPVNGDRGYWSGDRGESDFILNEPIVLSDGTEITKVTYRNAVPDFSPYQVAEVNVPHMINDRNVNYRQADEALAEIWTAIRHNGQTWTARDVATYREHNSLTWHEMSNMESMQLVPTAVNEKFGHCGGVAEYNAMIGQEGVGDYD